MWVCSSRHSKRARQSPSLAGDDLEGVLQLPVREIRLVAAQVEVDAGGAGDRPAHPVRVHRLRREDAHAARTAAEDLVAEHQLVVDVHPRAHVGDGLPARGRSQPAGQVLLEAADPVEHVVHPAAGDLLHDVLELLALPERVEDRGDPAQFQRVRAEEHQVVEDPVQLGEQRPRPHRALGDLHAEHPLDGQDDAQLVGEGGQPVVAVGEHDDLAVVARLEELLRAAVHIADDRLGVLDPLAVEDEPQPQHTVRGGVLGADVEHHVGALRGAADADRGLRREESWDTVSRTYAGGMETGSTETAGQTTGGGRAGLDRAACRGCCGCGGCCWWCGWGC